MHKLPRVPPSKFQESKGMRLVREAVEDQSKGLGWIFRGKLETDVGIDAEAEMVNKFGQATGKLLSLQIKTGPSYLKEVTVAENGYVYRGDEEHLNYWLQHSLPVLLVLVEPTSRRCHWVEVTAGSARRLSKGWKIKVPFKNEITAAQRHQLSWIASRDTQGTLIQLNLVRWLYNRFFGRVHVLDTWEAPDIHWWKEIACIDGEMVGVHPIVDRYGVFDIKDINEALRHRDGNRRAGVRSLFLCFVCKAPQTLRLSQDIITLLSAEPDIRFFRFLNDGDYLSEVLPNDEVVSGYSNGEHFTFGDSLSRR